MIEVLIALAIAVPIVIIITYLQNRKTKQQSPKGVDQ